MRRSKASARRLQAPPPVLTGLAFASVVVGIVLQIVVSPKPVGVFLHDAFSFHDTALRIAAGQVPNIDFMSPMGFVSAYTAYATYLLLGPGNGYISSNVVVLPLLITIIAIIYFNTVSYYKKYVIPVSILGLIIIFTPSHEEGLLSFSPSYAFYYNKLAVGMMAIGMIPQFFRQKNRIIVAAVSGLIFWLILMTKAPFAAYFLIYCILAPRYNLFSRKNVLLYIIASVPILIHIFLFQDHFSAWLSEIIHYVLIGSNIPNRPGLGMTFGAGYIIKYIVVLTLVMAFSLFMAVVYAGRKSNSPLVLSKGASCYLILAFMFSIYMAYMIIEGQSISQYYLFPPILAASFIGPVVVRSLKRGRPLRKGVSMFLGAFEAFLWPRGQHMILCAGLIAWIAFEFTTNIGPFAYAYAQNLADPPSSAQAHAAGSRTFWDAWRLPPRAELATYRKRSERNAPETRWDPCGLGEDIYRLFKQRAVGPDLFCSFKSKPFMNVTDIPETELWIERHREFLRALMSDLSGPQIRSSLYLSIFQLYPVALGYTGNAASTSVHWNRTYTFEWRAGHIEASGMSRRLLESSFSSANTIVIPKCAIDQVVSSKFKAYFVVMHMNEFRLFKDYDCFSVWLRKETG